MRLPCAGAAAAPSRAFTLVAFLGLAAMVPEWLPAPPSSPRELMELAGMADLRPPVWVERLLHNPRERTAAGLEALADGRPEDAARAFETAARIAPDDPRALYSAGAGRLAAGEDPERAAELLGRAAEILEGTPGAGPAGLVPAVLYDLGNAHLAADDPAAAADAFRRTLRREPGLDPARRNLEIALARLERQRRLLPPREAPGGERPGEEERSEETGPEGTERAEEEPRPETGPEGGPEGGEGGHGDHGADRPARAPGPLPAPGSSGALERFDEQGDMTAGQAAALLHAVEALERRQLRGLAEERAARSGKKKGEKDW